MLFSGRPVATGNVGADTSLDASVFAEVLLAQAVCGEVTADLANGYRGMFMPAVL